MLLASSSAPTIGLLQIIVPLIILIVLAIVVKAKIAKIIIKLIIAIFVIINVLGLFGISLNIFGMNLNGVLRYLIIGQK